MWTEFGPMVLFVLAWVCVYVTDHFFRDAGVTEFVAKPISASALCARIEAVLLRPRDFVRAPAFVGPSRRRRDDADHNGPERRGGG